MLHAVGQALAHSQLRFVPAVPPRSSGVASASHCSRASSCAAASAAAPPRAPRRRTRKPPPPAPPRLRRRVERGVHRRAVQPHRGACPPRRRCAPRASRSRPRAGPRASTAERRRVPRGARRRRCSPSSEHTAEFARASTRSAGGVARRRSPACVPARAAAASARASASARARKHVHVRGVQLRVLQGRQRPGRARLPVCKSRETRRRRGAPRTLPEVGASVPPAGRESEARGAVDLHSWKNRVRLGVLQDSASAERITGRNAAWHRHAASSSAPTLLGDEHRAVLPSGTTRQTARTVPRRTRWAPPRPSRPGPASREAARARPARRNARGSQASPSHSAARRTPRGWRGCPRRAKRAAAAAAHTTPSRREPA